MHRLRLKRTKMRHPQLRPSARPKRNNLGRLGRVGRVDAPRRMRERLAESAHGHDDTADPPRLRKSHNDVGSG
jgi:hypothetical protein